MYRALALLKLPEDVAAQADAGVIKPTVDGQTLIRLVVDAEVEWPLAGVG